MTTIRAAASGYKASGRVLKALGGNVDDFIERALDSMVEKVKADINNELQNKQHIMTGELLGEDKLLEKGKGYRVIGTRKIQGRILEHGRGIVRPRNAKVLRFVNKQGDVVYTKESGPVDPDPVFEPNIIKNSRKVKDVIVNEVSKSIKENNHD